MSGSQCVENPPSFSSSTSGAAGSLQELEGFKTYVTGPQDSKLAILLISDVFGYEAPNLRKLADKVAAAGYLVVVPDFFYGDPYDLSKDLQSWVKVHDTVRGFKDSKTIISVLKSKGVSAIGAAGFCWGGMVVPKLAQFDDLKAAVILHPGVLPTDDEIDGVKVPIAILAAEFDQHCPAEQVKHIGEILSGKTELDSFVKIYPGVSHGWTTRYKDDDESAVKSAEEAHGDMLNWFTKHMKSDN